ncbi:hypothetical protein STAS_04728 [Striga asiatica]|uniref:Uncharacterized protein n=1 Tax=Striga asiatica TaxID=4170 RepID=A0A5A7P7W6_STRAF|nr:hypothetical protein STAS_04728 [Striga asiatica]
MRNEQISGDQRSFHMANSYTTSNFRVNRVLLLRVILVVVGLLLICCVERQSKKYSITSCPTCSCDCDPEPTVSLPLDVINNSFADCGKDDPETYNELKKDLIAVLSEEISLHENVTTDTLQRTKALIMGTNRTSSHYQKEAAKCNIEMETCEEARERAEVALIEERKLTTSWMSRAHEFGWEDDSNDF